MFAETTLKLKDNPPLKEPSFFSKNKWAFVLGAIGVLALVLTALNYGKTQLGGFDFSKMGKWSQLTLAVGIVGVVGSIFLLIWGNHINKQNNSEIVAPVEKTPACEKPSKEKVFEILEKIKTSDEQFEMAEPKRRVPPHSGNIDVSAMELADKIVFVQDKNIIKKHNMKFLPGSHFISQVKVRDYQQSQIQEESYWAASFKNLEKNYKAIAVTDSGKHVILQQNCQSCGHACMGMLLLDRNKTPDFSAIKYKTWTNDEAFEALAQKQGLKATLTKVVKIEVLKEKLKAQGPGILGINAPAINGHYIILDEISGETATIRDPFHGWMITISLETLSKMRPNSFIQLIE